MPPSEESPIEEEGFPVDQKRSQIFRQALSLPISQLRRTMKDFLRLIDAERQKEESERNAALVGQLTLHYAILAVVLQETEKSEG